MGVCRYGPVESRRGTGSADVPEIASGRISHNSRLVNKKTKYGPEV